jgi:queuine tRNA-ribosyltransferase
MSWYGRRPRCPNAMAALHGKMLRGKRADALRPLRLVSFEWDLDPLTLATKNPGRFPHLRHGAPFQILASGQWQHPSSLLRWELLRGNFPDLIESAAIPDLIFYDPFSYKTDPALWTAELFARILKRCLKTQRSTPTASTAMRSLRLVSSSRRHWDQASRRPHRFHASHSG